VSTEGRLSHAEIRRALAECMTLANIDEAMDWEPGTARRLRWGTGPDHLPFADAELGGVPIWFRSTVETWRAALPEPQPVADEPEPVADEEEEEADEDEDPTDEDPEAEPAEEPDPRAVHSGFDLSTGQRVTANIRGRWREAVVTHRDRATVAVDYNIDDTPHGLRRQRVSVDRIRLRDAD
jgi:hypothetical protein